MPSTFAWLDFSDRDRRRALQLVDLLREEGTQDELGLGVIRDAFADRLFPGTSTIQTRVRYFLFLPWLLRDLRSRDAVTERFPAASRALQDRLRQSLVAGGESRGVIGFRARGDLKRLPSSVYWYGLRVWGILRFDGSEGEYGRAYWRKGLAHGPLRNDDKEVIQDGATLLWDPGLPPRPPDLLVATAFDLTADEAEYLAHRLRMSAGESLLRHLVDLGADASGCQTAWDCMAPEALPDPLGATLEHARAFSETMHGAALLYNLMLAEERRDDDLVTSYLERGREWWTGLSNRRAALRRWDRVTLFALLASWGARVSLSTRAFVEAWTGAVVEAARAEALMTSPQLRARVRERERELKGPRARLGNPRALDLWRGASGTEPLDYRWGSFVRQMLIDLRKAARGER